MKSTESIENRTGMVATHQFFLDRINACYEAGQFVEAVWLIYSCMENRFFRTILKFKEQCPYSKGKCKKANNQLAISTKTSCIKRLCENNVECISSSFTVVQLEEIGKWIKQRNKLMHNLITSENSEGFDERFNDLATEGKNLVYALYVSCTEFRKKFFSADYIFKMPEAAYDKCSCKPNQERK